MDIVAPGIGKLPAIALVNPRYPHNVGAAVRAASCFRVPQVWFTGNRVSLVGDGKKYRLPREERMKGYNKVEIANVDYFFDAYGPEVVPVAVEVRENAEWLPNFQHPENALYVFGPEDGSLTRPILAQCHRFVRIPMEHCANLASAVYMVLYDRHAKAVQAGLEEPIGLAESRGWAEPDHMSEAVGVC